MAPYTAIIENVPTHVDHYSGQTIHERWNARVIDKKQCNDFLFAENFESRKEAFEYIVAVMHQYGLIKQTKFII